MDIEWLDIGTLNDTALLEYQVSALDRQFLDQWREAERRLEQDERAAGMAVCGGAE